ncbi:hypothetical protein SH2C18_09320 [Clostridium sediminicola]|uniref:ribose-5-phosphate isomerase n=1 Tax=Clostridium sediminicola TaxID=3114879 RepID=UPI0031F1EE4A
MFIRENYEIIISVICELKGIRREEVLEILNDREYRYLLFLLLEKHKCSDIGVLKNDFCRINDRKIKYSIKKGKEKILINRNFREKYFLVENKIKKLI